jgi:hypothetical protein
MTPRIRSFSSGDGLSSSLPCRVRVVISTRPFSGTKRSGRGMPGFRQSRKIVVDHSESASAIAAQEALKKRLAPARGHQPVGVSGTSPWGHQPVGRGCLAPARGGCLAPARGHQPVGHQPVGRLVPQREQHDHRKNVRGWPSSCTAGRALRAVEDPTRGPRLGARARRGRAAQGDGSSRSRDSWCRA